ncbi:MAG: hypothetical protein AVDCRST_MAG22-1217, partial [uncultured Rubrobacteraceae bacterium]
DQRQHQDGPRPRRDTGGAQRGRARRPGPARPAGGGGLGRTRPQGIPGAGAGPRARGRDARDPGRGWSGRGDRGGQPDV